MLSKIESFQNHIATMTQKLLLETSDAVFDRLYVIPSHFAFSSFPIFRESTTTWRDFPTHRYLQRVTQAFISWYEKVPFDHRIRAGEEIFHQFIKLRRRMIGAEEKMTPIKDGPVSYWATRRRSSKDTIVFLHGFGDSKDSIYDFAQSVVADYNFVAPDLPGFGSSFKDQNLAYTLPKLALWLQEWIEEIGLERIHLVGNSLGGAVAMHLALILPPERLRSLSLISPAAIVDFGHESLYNELINGENFFQIRTKEEFDNFLKRIFHGSLMLPPFIKDFQFHQFSKNYDWYGRLMAENLKGVSSLDDANGRSLFLNDDLPNLKVPTHIIWGRHDKIFPVAFGHAAHRLIANSRLTIMEEVGHAPQLENPKEFARIFREFLTSLYLA